MSSNFFMRSYDYSHSMMIFYVNGIMIISLDKTFECFQFHTGINFITKLKLLLNLQ